ncbi:hypothetical protein C4F40_17800 [Sphingobacterium sp. Ka21]|uniref:Uncharacterized protein n=1 Tax=Sphingobacterium pedocola TaxID=2082722 RepID=A0ABR9TB67_9SPHI|nr:hypothetical protein [Sphingobacterium pedocola]
MDIPYSNLKIKPSLLDSAEQASTGELINQAVLIHTFKLAGMNLSKTFLNIAKQSLMSTTKNEHK